MKQADTVISGSNVLLTLKRRKMLAVVVVLLFAWSARAQNPRQDICLNSGWHTVVDEQNANAYNNFQQLNFDDQKWQTVSVPHNWDQYYGYRRIKHGNLHGFAWYRKTFSLTRKQSDKRYFLYFEGVSSYATVWLNGQQVGTHAGGRTTFTLEVTNQIQAGAVNLLCVRADHPPMIKDLPWVCGGCSDENGFSEGSQPMGIFRPVHLVVTNAVRIQPFGVHIWNNTTVNEKKTSLSLETEVKNYDDKPASVRIISQLVDATGKVVAQAETAKNVKKGETVTIPQALADVPDLHLWSLENPYLYSVITKVYQSGQLKDQTETPYGVRWISWPINRPGNDKRFFLNGKPIFINGTAEYEHLMGKSHAFTPELIRSRMMQVKAAGFNAFRDAHQPHNLAYQQYCDKVGLLWWPQFTSNIWFDTPMFRENFKQLITEWVRERRNNPSNILWGLQNESHLPEEFARECTEIIRKLDPTASCQRKVTTCNGGAGTDWNVPQNWTGTYGGDPLTCGADLQRQILVGEYGAWRSLELHTEGPFDQNGPYSEERMAQLMETKVRLAEETKNKVAGHFNWLLYSHENPGRSSGGEGFREMDRIGPDNYKGLFTPWGQPLDVFYMYRANYAPRDKEPMVYIVSHTWPGRWTRTGIKDRISVYSNCDEVELFNDVGSTSLGRKKRGPVGTHFQWNSADIKYNVLYAVGYVNGKEVVHDQVVLHHLPAAPHLAPQQQESNSILKPIPGYEYIYRINCGGPDYTDSYANRWKADNIWTDSRSWAQDFAGIPPAFASQQRTFDPIAGTTDDALFQTFRYGQEKLCFTTGYPLEEGDYRIELFFTEPWYGIGGGLDATGWRLFDVAINGEKKIVNLDIFKESGYNRALKKVIQVHLPEGRPIISFPNVLAGEAIVSAIAIARKQPPVRKSATKSEIEKIKAVHLVVADSLPVLSWLDIGQHQYSDTNISFRSLPPVLYGAEWLQADSRNCGHAGKITCGERPVDLYVAIDVDTSNRPAWLKDFEATGLSVENDYENGHKMALFKKRCSPMAQIEPGLNPGKLMYTIFALPVSSIEPAFDLRKVISYSIDKAGLKGSAMKDTAGGKPVIKFTRPSGGSAAFSVTPGVADKYAFKIRYYNFTEKVLVAKMQLLAADGTTMKEEILSLKPVVRGKAGTLSTDSGTSINAGNYRVVLTAINAEGLCLLGMDMQ